MKQDFTGFWLSKRFFGLFCLIFVISIKQAKAFPTFGPIGSESGLLGNSGIALGASSSSGALNPASFHGIEGSRISASSSMLKMSRFSVASSSQIIDRTEAPQLQLGSAYVFSKQNIAGYDFGIFVSEDQNIKTTKYLEYFIFGEGASQIDLDFNLTRIGIVLSHDVSSKFYVGATPTLYFMNRMNSNQTKTDSGSFSSFQQFDKRSQQVLAALRLGVLANLDHLSIGSYAETKGLILSSSQTTLQSRVESNGNVTDDSNTRPTNEVTPPIFGVGIKLGSKEKLEFLFDYVYTFPVNYTDESESVDPEEQKMKTIKMNQYAAGVRWPSAAVSGFLSAGFQYSKYFDYLSSAQYQVNYLNFGVESKFSFLTTNLNLFYSGLKNITESTTGVENFGVSMGTEFSY